MALQFPMGFTVGSGPCGGVWNLSTGEVVRSFGDCYFSKLSLNGRFLAALESERNLMFRDIVFFGRVQSIRYKVALFDIQGTLTKRLNNPFN